MTYEATSNTKPIKPKAFSVTFLGITSDIETFPNKNFSRTKICKILILYVQTFANCPKRQFFLV